VFVGCEEEIEQNANDLGDLPLEDYVNWGEETASKPYVYFGVDDTTGILEIMDISAVDNNNTPDDYSDDIDLFFYCVEISSYNNNTIIGTYHYWDDDGNIHDGFPISIELSYTESSGLSLSFTGSGDGGLEGRSFSGLMPF
jgi:hypothetical protein